MRILDAHQHFWDLSANYHPWLADRPVPFRYGDYAAIRRDYMPDDYRRDAAGFDIAGTVYVETEWDPSDPAGEVDWVTALAAREGLPTAVVARARLDDPGVGDLLARYGRAPLVRGVRHKPRAARSPDAVEPGAPGSMGDPAWRRGYAMLAANGLSFDLQTPWWHLPEAADLAEAFPDTPIVLNHAGLPADRSEEGLAAWRAAIEVLARAPNAFVKVSGIGVPGRPWTDDLQRRVVLGTVEVFGVERAMVGSNFPVDALVATFGEIMGGFDRILAGFPEVERRALFLGNAARFYRIDPAALENAP